MATVRPHDRVKTADGKVGWVAQVGTSDHVDAQGRWGVGATICSVVLTGETGNGGPVRLFDPATLTLYPKPPPTVIEDK